jgi:hypothetical protein
VRLGAAMGGIGVAARGRGSRREGSGVAARLCVAVGACLLFVREKAAKQEGERRIERTKKRKEKKIEKRKNMNFFLNLIFFKK